MNPTKEQLAVVEAFETGENLVIEAGAGAGKTSTLKLLAQATDAKITYTAFNKAIVQEGKQKFPGNVTCRTVHSLAYSHVANARPELINRLRNSVRVNNYDVSKMLELPVTIKVADKVFNGERLAGYVLRGIGRFCQSAETAPQWWHFPSLPIDPELLGEDGRPMQGESRGANAKWLSKEMLPFMQKAWIDLTSGTGRLRFSHDHYLKLWQLDSPSIPGSIILLDEAQDANPVMCAVFLSQKGKQLVAVGDSNQAIYGFTGAQNALADLAASGANVRRLTQSFRFGPAIAEKANQVLATKTDFRVIGTDSIGSTAEPIESPDCILFRTNSGVLSALVLELDAGKKVCIADNLKANLTSFALGVKDLMKKGTTDHPELSCFASWDAVVHASTLPAGEDLVPLVRIINSYGADWLLDALGTTTTDQTRADITLTTAHTSKGREWDSVQLGGDFPPNPEGEEANLLYVAVTRAKLALDIMAVEFFNPKEKR